MVDYQKLGRKAASAANSTRLSLNYDLVEPVSAYEICADLDMIVRFVDVNMEGLYEAGPPPRIFLSSERPLSRRHFTCAHELGHHVFNHGSRIDELQASSRAGSPKPADETLVDMFAGHLLMPTIGLNRSINRRKLNASDLNPIDVLHISSEYGVGYETLLTHLSFGMRFLPLKKRARLIKEGISVRKNMKKYLGTSSSIFIDGKSFCHSITMEVQQILLSDKKIQYDSKYIQFVNQTIWGLRYDIIQSGTTYVTIDGNCSDIQLNIAPHKFNGLAKYRFLEEIHDED